MTAAEWIALTAVIISGVAGYYAYRAPIRAAEIAETLRQGTLQRERQEAVFNILMAERGNWGSGPMISALNSIKIIFRDNRPILEKWYALNSKAGTDGSPSQYFDLLAEIGNALGHAYLRREDPEMFFTNPTFQKETAVRQHHIDIAFNQLTANTAGSQS